MKVRHEWIIVIASIAAMFAVTAYGIACAALLSDNESFGRAPLVVVRQCGIP